MLSTLLLCTALTASPVARDLPVHLGVSLRLTHPGELAALQQALQDPRSPQFRRWLTPRQFGERFGQSEATYRAFEEWLASGGLSVKTAPNRAFLEATGTADQVQRLLRVKLLSVDGQPASVHTLSGRPQVPSYLAPVLLNISGLDTRIRFKHRLQISNGMSSMGPQDLRAMYGMQSLLDQGYAGQGLSTAVLSTAASTGNGPSPTAISWFFQNIANARAPLVQHVIPNPQNDVDPQPGSGIEFDLDTEMHSVGVPGAAGIILVVSPASEVFTTGANEIANALPDVAAVSISLGICEPGEQQNVQLTGMDEITALRNAVIQGTVEGQTWSAATGDNGADDCRNGMGPTVDFPSDIPEMIGAGGSELKPATFDANHAITAYQQEVTWNDGAQGGAAGGGVSTIFPLPAYQSANGLTGTGRNLPDIALMSGNPGVAVASVEPPGQLDPVLGTSVASPLSAGAFALLASRLGCRLGDIHGVLYALGAAQQTGGAAVFHDITTGNLTYNNVTGPSAATGYDNATGWGALDVAALAAAFPACPTDGDGGLPDAGLDPYAACQYAGCDAGCLTIPEGPSTCETSCDLTNPGCAPGTVCNGTSIFASGTTGLCVPGCASAADCAAQPGTVCSLCAQVCIPQGSPTNVIGGACATDVDCPSGAFCFTGRSFTGGYCTLPCTKGVTPTDACACPSGSECGTIGRFAPTDMCLETCSYPGEGCGRTGYLCQPQNAGSPACLPKCVVRTTPNGTFDTCTSFGTSLACDLDSGVCGGPQMPVDAGVDAGTDAGVDAGEPPDAGSKDPVSVTVVPNDLGKSPSGCGCSVAGPLPFGLALLLLARRKRR